MAFDLEKFFVDIFGPQKGEVVTFMVDSPHGDINDTPAWEERREMARQWHNGILKLAPKLGVTLNPVLFYNATGSGNAELPKTGEMGSETVEIEAVLRGSDIVISMPEYSATAPLKSFAKKTKRQRIASMPGIIKDMENTGLSADYTEIARRCKTLAPYFEAAIGAEVEFSTGHKCSFDISADQKVHISDGVLTPDRRGFTTNLPGGEVYIVPNEATGSKTQGELPQRVGDELIVYIVEKNKIVDVKGDGPNAAKMRERCKDDPGWRNIAEFAIGCNDKAKVRGIIVEDEKAGFHWAYGRSDHFGGTVGPEGFKTQVVHQDVVYAKGCPIECKRLDMINKDGTKKTLIINGELQI